nr:RNA-directed DNA polymerase, eukaryota [Tanacetum cinerariifolium]
MPSNTLSNTFIRLLISVVTGRFVRVSEQMLTRVAFLCVESGASFKVGVAFHIPRRVFMPLHVMFPRIFALETDKDSMVGSKLGPLSVDVSFRRPVRDGAERQQWKVRSLLDNIFLPSANVPTRWVKFIPIKINIFAWRARLDRLPTRSILMRRGVVMDSDLCPMCSTVTEDIFHVLFRCDLAALIFRKIWRWWELDWQALTSFEDWNVWFSAIRLSSKIKSMLEGVCYVAWWHLWVFRNHLIFNATPLRRSVIFDDIVSRYYFCDNPMFSEAVFEDRFRMSRSLFTGIVEELTLQCEFFREKEDCTEKLEISSLIKCASAISQLAYNTVPDALDEYLQMGSLDCTDWVWFGCPIAHKAQYCRRDHGPDPFILLEAVASNDLWIWHAFFGVSGSNNDINVTQRSPLLNDLKLVTNLADDDYKRLQYKTMHEAARKDVEWAFGVLKKKRTILASPAPAYIKEELANIMYTCIILHNMIIKDRKEAISPKWYPEEEHQPDDLLRSDETSSLNSTS